MSFDKLMEIESQEWNDRKIKPFWQVSLNDDEDILKWMNKTYDLLKSASIDRFDRYKQNIKAFRGMTQQSRSIRPENSDVTRTNPRRKINIQMNDLYDIIEQQVSKETRFRPAVNVNPPSSGDHSDKMSSKVIEKINQGIWYQNNIDAVFKDHSRNTKILGESYILTLFNKEKGDYHPDWLKEIFKANGIKKDPEKITRKELRKILRNDIKKNKKIEIKDPETGETIKVNKPIRIGEIEYEVGLALNFFLQPKNKYEKCEWGFYITFEDIEDLRYDYPEKSEEIKESKGIRYFDAETLQEQELVNQALVINFWHKSTDKLDGGIHIKCTKDAILVNEENYCADLEETNGFPWIRRVDVQIPGRLHGVAAMEFGVGLQDWINKLSSLLIRSQALTAHPKWLAPLNSVKAENLANDSTLLWYSGAVPPTLIQPNPGASNTFQLIENFTQKLQQILGVFGVSRGEPPTGIKAGIALQFLNEQENERANSSILDHNLNIKQLARLTIYTAGEFYDEADGRLEKILGSEHARLAKYFDMAALGKSWDFQVQTASALPQQKAQRVQAIFDLKERFPEKIDDDEVLDQIGFGPKDTFVNINTSNIRTAEAENEEIMMGSSAEKIEPVAYENHLIHYRIHIRKLSVIEMKDKTVPEKMVQNLKDHIGAHELFLSEQTKKNPQLLPIILAEFPFFPLFLEKEIPPPLPPLVPGMGLGEGEIPPEELINQLAQPPVGPSPQAQAGQEFPQVENQLPVGA